MLFLKYFSIIRLSLLVPVLLLLTLTTYADTDYTTAYHPHINDAEMLLIEKEYMAALVKYEFAFKAVPEPFARDYYNAAVCAMLTENYKHTFTYLEKLVLKGVSLPYIRKQEVFKPLHETKEWTKFLKQYPKMRGKYKRQADLDIRADLDELYARDRYFRLAKGGLRVYGDTLRKIEDANVDLLLKTIQKYGYPGEKLIGVGDTIEQLPRFSIVIERQTKAKKGFDFSDVLTEAVRQGHLSPQAAAYLIETQQGVRSYRTRAIVRVSCANAQDCEGDKKLKTLNKFLTEDLNRKEEIQVDGLRVALGLEPLSEYRRKVLYSLDDDRFMLGYKWSVANYVAPSKEAAKVLTEGLVLAVKSE